ncbi:tubulin-specific chaperone cofactor E-like protein [Oppia nitens]|uniref:tubulin-specific chaperone cofactor E-like protein n=1 Tax=Oppia nitens TaxID=1686743 RepID=UPI0023DA6889|nr:tubulin-specific chaperone cofactor E-like protein [Oppia nitens]
MSFNSFVDVLLQRYADYQLDDCPYEVFVVGGLSPGAKSGNHLILPPALSLNKCRVKSAGPEKKIRELCSTVEELDLASNNLIDMREVFKIARSMPNLRFINLSENNLTKCNIESLGKHRFENIRSLVLNNTRIPWYALRILLDSMPSVDDLHLSLNDYSSVDLNPGHKYLNIKYLYLSGNPQLSNWEDLKKLMRTFPCLEGLTMADCNISTIPEEAIKYLPNLQSLNITNWPIKSWQCIERLNHLPKLRQLRCQGLHLLNGIEGPESRRHHLIARLPNIHRLNGSDITEDERVFAEKAFLRWYVMNEHWEKPQKFFTLLSIHGRVDPIAELDFSPPKHAEVQVVYNEDEITNEDNEKTHKKQLKIDLNKSVGDFKSELGSMFGVSPTQMRVFYVDSEMSDLIGPELLRFNQKKLYTYNVRDGDQFLIDHK